MTVAVLRDVAATFLNRLALINMFDSISLHACPEKDLERQLLHPFLLKCLRATVTIAIHHWAGTKTAKGIAG